MWNFNIETLQWVQVYMIQSLCELSLLDLLLFSPFLYATFYLGVHTSLKTWIWLIPENQLKNLYSFTQFHISFPCFLSITTAERIQLERKKTKTTSPQATRRKEPLEKLGLDCLIAQVLVSVKSRQEINNTCFRPREN